MRPITGELPITRPDGTCTTIKVSNVTFHPTFRTGWLEIVATPVRVMEEAAYRRAESPDRMGEVVGVLSGHVPPDHVEVNWGRRQPTVVYHVDELEVVE
jgi:hypothetical protein